DARGADPDPLIPGFVVAAFGRPGASGPAEIINDPRRLDGRVEAAVTLPVRASLSGHAVSCIASWPATGFGSDDGGLCMTSERPGRPDAVIGPDGVPMTLSDLPPPGTKRWVIRRKAEVVAGVRAGLISLEEACERYTLSVEEFLSWQKLIDRHGLRGLRVTRLQDYRGGEKSSSAPSGALHGAARRH